MEDNTSRFEVVVLDEDRRCFSVAGPMANDTALDRRIERHRSTGRNLRYELIDERLTKEDLIAATILKTGYRYIVDVFIDVISVLPSSR